MRASTAITVSLYLMDSKLYRPAIWFMGPRLSQIWPIAVTNLGASGIIRTAEFVGHHMCNRMAPTSFLNLTDNKLYSGTQTGQPASKFLETSQQTL